jgi:hypothetical protein
VTSAHRLVAAYAGLWVLLDLVAVVPGGDFSYTARGLVASLVIQSLLVWRLSLGSRTAWALGLILALSSVAWVGLQAASVDAFVVVAVVLFLAQTGVLLSAQLRGFAGSHRRQPPAAA